VSGTANVALCPVAGYCHLQL